MQAVGDIISYFPPIILIVTLKSAQNPTGGKYMIFFSPSVFIFFPLGHAIIVLSQTMYWGEKMARGKSNHTMFNKIMGNFEKNAGNREHNIIFFPYYFNCHAKKCKKIQVGENI